MPQVTELMSHIRKILEEERDLNSDDPLVVSLLTRIANRIAECAQQIENDDQKK